MRWFITRNEIGDTKWGCEVLFRSYYKELFYIAYSMTNDYFLSEDIIQETFMKVYLKLPELKNSESIRGGLCKIVKTTSIDHLRKQNKWEKVNIPIDYINEFEISSYMTVEEEVESKWFRKNLLEKIASIDYPFKEVIMLKYLYDYNLYEISEVTGVPIGTVKSRLYRARTKIEKIMISQK